MLAKFRGVEYRCKARKIADSKACLAYASDPGIEVKVPRLAFDLDEINPRSLLEILIHESLHACLWDLDEKAVTETAHDITKFLKQLGATVDAKRVRRILRNDAADGRSPRRSTRRHTGKS